jgi:hypothetical protein
VLTGIKRPDGRGSAILRRLPARPATVAEVGCFVGMLSRYLLMSRPDIKLFMIDNWAPKEEQPRPYVDTGDRHANQTVDECRYYRLKAKKRVHRFGGRVSVVCMHSLGAALLTEDHSLDLVFLDADHSEPGVAADIAAWVPKVKPGGYIGGHDFANDQPMTNFSGVERAVRSWAKEHDHNIELDADYTWFCRC